MRFAMASSSGNTATGRSSTRWMVSDGGVDEFVIPRLYGRYVILSRLNESSAPARICPERVGIFGRRRPFWRSANGWTSRTTKPVCPGYLANDARYDTGWASRDPAGGWRRGNRHRRHRRATHGCESCCRPARASWSCGRSGQRGPTHGTIASSSTTANPRVPAGAFAARRATPHQLALAGQGGCRAAVHRTRCRSQSTSWPWRTRLFGPAAGGGMLNRPLLNLTPPTRKA